MPDTISRLTAVTRLGVFQFVGPAADVTPLSLPPSLTVLRGLRELGLSLPAWHPVLKGLTGLLTRLMVRSSFGPIGLSTI